MPKKKKDEITIRSSAAEYLTYIASVGDNPDSMEMRYEDENIWLTQKMMATLYDVEVNTINYHIKKIFSDSELQEGSVIRKFRITADDGKNYNTNHYSLENTSVAFRFMAAEVFFLCQYYQYDNIVHMKVRCCIMNQKFMDALMNPVLCKLIMDVNSCGKMTAKQLAQSHPDIAQATLYRHLKRLTTDGIIKVVAENRVRGTVERTYALAVDFAADINGIVESNSGEAYLAMFMQYIAGLAKLFEVYCKRDDIDIKGDISAYNAIPFYATDEELMRTLRQMEGILADLLKNKPSKDRKLRTLGFILTPPEDEKDKTSN